MNYTASPEQCVKYAIQCKIAQENNNKILLIASISLPAEERVNFNCRKIKKLAL